jgi:hypothetical protein
MFILLLLSYHKLLYVLNFPAKIALCVSLLVCACYTSLGYNSFCLFIPAIFSRVRVVTLPNVKLPSTSSNLYSHISRYSTEYPVFRYHYSIRNTQLLSLCRLHDFCRVRFYTFHQMQNVFLKFSNIFLLSAYSLPFWHLQWFKYKCSNLRHLLS